MTGRSHLLLGAMAVLCAMRWHVLAPEPLSVCTGLLGSVIPDIDTERSMLGSRVKPLSRLLARQFGHRGLTHSAVLLLILAVCVDATLGQRGLQGPVGAILFGMGTHIAADLPTGGCQLLAPLSRSRIALWPYVKTGGIGEKMLLLPALALMGWLAWGGQHRFSITSGSFRPFTQLRGAPLRDISLPP